MREKTSDEVFEATLQEGVRNGSLAVRDRVLSYSSDFVMGPDEVTHKQFLQQAERFGGVKIQQLG